MLPKFTIYQPNGWSNSILPLDVLHKIINEMNVVIDEVNNIEDHSVEIAKAYTDSQIAIVNGEIATTNATIEQINNSLLADIRSINTNLNILTQQLNTYGERLTDLSNRESNHYSEINSRFTQVYRDINSFAVQLRNYADIKDLVLKEQLEAEIEEIRVVINNILNVKTIDGFTGSIKTVREILGTRILLQTKLKGANRYALSWGQISQTTKNGWLAKYNSRVNNKINYLAPTWHNFMLNNYQFTSSQLNNLNANNLNTWGAFCNLTLLYIGDIVHKINQYCTSGTAAIATNFKTVDVYKKAEWDTYLSDGTPVPGIETVDVTALYDGTNSHVSLIVTQFKASLAIFTGAVVGYGLYASSSTANALFSTTSDLPALFQFLQGNLNLPYFSSTFFSD